MLRPAHSERRSRPSDTSERAGRRVQAPRPTPALSAEQWAQHALILEPSVAPNSAPSPTPSGCLASDSLEACEAKLDGFTVTLANAAQWSAMTTVQFEAYQVLIIGDPRCQNAGTGYTTAAATAGSWSRPS